MPWVPILRICIALPAYLEVFYAAGRVYII